MGRTAEPIQKKWGAKEHIGRSVTLLFCQLAFLGGMARNEVKVDLVDDLIEVKGKL